MSGGRALYLEKERAARAYPERMRSSADFRSLVADWNAARARRGLRAVPVTLPDYTDEELALDTIRGFNGYAGGLHEFRVRRVNGTLAVTLDDTGTRGTAEWERVPVNERGTRGDPNYVHHIEAQPDF